MIDPGNDRVGVLPQHPTGIDHGSVIGIVIVHVIVIVFCGM